MENNHGYYVASKYLGQIELSIEALRKVDKDELLSIPFFSEPLFNLIMAGVVAKIEEYLKDRLELEVYSSDETLYKYAEAYIAYNREQRCKKCKKWINAIESQNTKEVKDLVGKIEYNGERGQRCKKCKMWINWEKAITSKNTEEVKDLVGKSLDKHIYHNIDMLASYFSAISNIKIGNMDNYNKIKELIQLRHKIIHPTKDDLKLPIYKIIDACSHSFAFIKDIESEFLQSGRQPICDDPW